MGAIHLILALNLLGTPTEGLLLSGGPIWSADAAAKHEALLIVGDGIAYVGTVQGAEKVANEQKLKLKRIALEGRQVMPGFIDAHIHIASGGFQVDRVELAHAKSKEETFAAIKAFAAKNPKRAWILGRGWSYQAFKDKYPTREELDRLLPDRPAYLRSYDGHSAWANTLALKAAGIDANTRDPEDGTIVRGDDKKTPAGTLLEGAMSLVSAVIPKPTEAEHRRAILEAAKHAAKHGITTMGEVGGSFKELAIYEGLEREGLLPLRVVYGPMTDEGFEAYAPIKARLDAARSRSKRVFAGPMKAFVDGVIESNTAHLLEPYADKTPAGAPHLDDARVRSDMLAADKLGIDIAFHAIGDAAVRSVLDGAEAVNKAHPPRDRRFRVEHIEVVDAVDLPRFRSLNVIASMMPIHAEPGDEPNGGVWSTKVGAKRLERAFAFNDVLKAGATLAFSSDWPVMSLNPFSGIAVAVSRQGKGGVPPTGWIPAQRITLRQAVHGYSEGAAYAARVEKETGRLDVGFAADCVILPRGTDLAKANALYDLVPDATIAAGKVVAGKL